MANLNYCGLQGIEHQPPGSLRFTPSSTSPQLYRWIVRWMDEWIWILNSLSSHWSENMRPSTRVLYIRRVSNVQGVGWLLDFT